MVLLSSEQHARAHRKEVSKMTTIFIAIYFISIIAYAFEIEKEEQIIKKNDD